MSIRVLIRAKGGRNKLTLYYIDPDTGKEVTKSSGTLDQGEAERAAAIWEQQLLKFRGKDGAGWDYFRDRFRDEHLAAKRKRTRQAFSVALNAIERLTPVSNLSELSAGVLSQFQAALLAEGKPLTTVSNYLGHLRTSLNWAAYVGIIGQAPKIRIPRSGKRKWMKGRPLSEAEHKKMLQACPVVMGLDYREWRRLLELLWLSGLRLEEAVALSWDSPPVQVLLDADPYPHIIFHADGQKSNEDEACPIPPDLAAWLQKVKRPWRKGPVINLIGERGKLTPEAIGREVTRIGEAAGIVVNAKSKWASAHDYRRSFGTRWAAKVRPMTLQRMMRHKEFTTTLKYYIGIEAEDVGAELWGKKRVSRNVSRKPRHNRRKAE